MINGKYVEVKGQGRRMRKRRRREVLGGEKKEILLGGNEEEGEGRGKGGLDARGKKKSVATGEEEE